MNVLPILFQAVVWTVTILFCMAIFAAYTSPKEFVEVAKRGKEPTCITFAVILIIAAFLIANGFVTTGMAYAISGLWCTALFKGAAKS